MRGAKGGGHGRGHLGRETFGDLPGEVGIGGAQFGVRAIGVQRDNAFADLKVRDARTDLDHRAGGLVAHDVGSRAQIATQAIQGVTAFDADGFDLDEDLVVAGRRVGYIPVAKDARRAVLVVDRCLHGIHPSTR